MLLAGPSGVTCLIVRSPFCDASINTPMPHIASLICRRQHTHIVLRHFNTHSNTTVPDLSDTCIQPIEWVVLINLIPQSQWDWSVFNGTWQKRRRRLDNLLGFEIANALSCTMCCVRVRADSKHTSMPLPQCTHIHTFV